MFLNKANFNSAIETTKKAIKSEEAQYAASASKSIFKELMDNKAVRNIAASTGFFYMVGLLILPWPFTPSLCATFGCLLAIHGLLTK